MVKALLFLLFSLSVTPSLPGTTDGPYAGSHDVTKIDSLNACAQLLLMKARLDSSISLAANALSIAESLGVTKSAAMSHRILANVYRWRGPGVRWSFHADSSLRLYQQLDDSLEMVTAMCMAADAHITDWTMHCRDSVLRTALDLSHRRNDAHSLATVLIEMSRGKDSLRERENLLRHALHLADSLRDERTQARALSFLAYAFIRGHAPDQAFTRLTEASVLCSNLNDSLWIADGHSDIADALVYQGAYDSAIVYLNRAIRIFQKAGARVYERVALFRLGEAYAGKNDLRAADRYWQKSWLLYEELFPDRMAKEAALQTRFAFEKRIMEQKLRQSMMENERQNSLFGLAAAGLIIAALTIGFAVKRKRAQMLARKNGIIAHQKNVIEKNLRDLRETTASLQRNLVALDSVKNDLHAANTTLEKRVLERTTQLYTANKELRKEIREREQLQRQVAYVQKMESLGTLVGGIAHDFNNILAIAVTHASLIRPGISTAEELNTRIAAIRRAGERGAALVRQLMMFARNTESDTEPVFINDIIIELKQLLAETFSRDIAVHLHLADSLYPFIGDKTLIHQALLNLCLNARDAMPNGGVLTITTSMVSHENCPAFADIVEGEYIRITVNDTGIGMDKRTLERIFEPFFTTKEASKGTGLGLAVTYGAVSSHKGCIHVDSKPGEGTTFTIHLPAMRQIVGLEQSCETLVEEIAGGSETVLVIEDEIDLQRTLKEGLEAKGYRVFTASSGIDAINICNDHGQRIDVVVSDIGLPGVDGIKAYEYVQKIFPHIRAIFASGYLDAHQKERLRTLGVYDFINKPFGIAEILMRLRRVLDSESCANKVTTPN